MRREIVRRSELRTKIFSLATDAQRRAEIRRNAAEINDIFIKEHRALIIGTAGFSMTVIGGIVLVRRKKSRTL